MLGFGAGLLVGFAFIVGFVLGFLLIAVSMVEKVKTHDFIYADGKATWVERE